MERDVVSTQQRALSVIKSLHIFIEPVIVLGVAEVKDDWWTELSWVLLSAQPPLYRATAPLPRAPFTG
ncbi:unnamed protein product [Danaus chrysippus]|uniref:(African queen) hypothetical protein n=1 Tax=Danaus chrysippus TaxID=151541 RepID=A0A8J2R5E1_9NEOP|nr:unnamed protein product [Danaus chrysippus]